MPLPKLVTFDVYMALLDIEGSLVPVAQEALGLTGEAAISFVRLWRAKQMERAAISNTLEKGRTSFRDCSAMALDYCLGRHQLTVTPDIRWSLILSWDTIKPWPDAEAAITAVKAKGCKTAILSNGDQNMLEAVADNFSSGAFDHILSSETAGHYKPHPAVYELPTKVLGIAKSDVLHVAGSANDVLGSIAADMRCIWSNRHADQVLDPAYPPTHEISNLGEVAPLLDI
ncbi:MAG: haloacid dehalogenase type II [Hyphomicrobiaceae bacterium]